MKKLITISLSIIITSICGWLYAADTWFSDWASETGSKTLKTPASGKHLLINHCIYSTDTANYVYLLDGGTAITGKWYFGANSGDILPLGRKVVGTSLQAWTSASGNASMTCVGEEL